MICMQDIIDLELKPSCDTTKRKNAQRHGLEKTSDDSISWKGGPQTLY